MRAVEGLAALLEETRRRGLRIGLASSAPQINVDLVLDELKLQPWFEVVLSEKDAVKGKPDPAIFLTMSERLGVAPESCLVFEDSLAGIEAAVRAGCRCIALATTHSAASLQRSSLPYAVISDFREFEWNWAL
jgi:HAD superfamily hydrolase (TIGR01509 family)